MNETLMSLIVVTGGACDCDLVWVFEDEYVCHDVFLLNTSSGNWKLLSPEKREVCLCV